MTKLKKKVANKAIKQAINNNNILILGAGLTGKAVADFYQKFYPDNQIIIYDSRDINNNNNYYKNINISSGQEGYKKLKNLNDDILKNINQIILSPGIHPKNILINNLINFLKTKNPKINIRSELDLFISHAKAPIIAITGTNGKSTVCKLVHDMLISCNKKSLLGGNFGPPAISLLNYDIPIPDYYVIEISSFQLSQTPNFKAYIGCILNISQDHLDYHENYNEYKKSKLRIFQNADYIITPDKINPDKINLDKNIYNLNNIAAIKIAEILGLNKKTYLNSIQNHKNLPHRYQIINNKNNIYWINDSKATNIGATQYALEKAKISCQNQIILILGGDPKAQDFSILINFIENNKIPIKAICLIGSQKNQDYLDNIINKKINTYNSKNLLTACKICKKVAKKNDLILLSPACSSLDEYKSYAKRGDYFIKSVAEINK